MEKWGGRFSYIFLPTANYKYWDYMFTNCQRYSISSLLCFCSVLYASISRIIVVKFIASLKLSGLAEYYLHSLKIRSFSRRGCVPSNWGFTLHFTSAHFILFIIQVLMFSSNSPNNNWVMNLEWPVHWKSTASLVKMLNNYLKFSLLWILADSRNWPYILFCICPELEIHSL